MSLSPCPEMRKLQEEELAHDPEYDEEFTERELEHLTYKEEEEHHTPAYKKWSEDHSKRFEKHLITCQHQNCVRVRKNWQEANMFKYYKPEYFFRVWE